MDGGKVDVCVMALRRLKLARQKPIQLCDWDDNVSQRSIWLDQAPCDEPSQRNLGNATEIQARLFQFKSPRRDADFISISIVMGYWLHEGTSMHPKKRPHR
jgi:hypothetical protein